MGEKLCDVGELYIKKQKFVIELNQTGENGREIHIQNESLRFALSRENFLKIARSILSARKIFKELKNGKLVQTTNK